MREELGGEERLEVRGVGVGLGGGVVGVGVMAVGVCVGVARVVSVGVPPGVGVGVRGREFLRLQKMSSLGMRAARMMGWTRIEFVGGMLIISILEVVVFFYS